MRLSNVPQNFEIYPWLSKRHRINRQSESIEG